MSGQADRRGRAGARWLALSALAALFLSAPLPAFADEPGGAAARAPGAGRGKADPRAEARAKIDEGARLTEQGRYADALRAFEEAYALYPSSKIQFNIALANEELARYAAAFEAMTLFLAEPRDVAPAKIARARQVLEALAKRVGRITVGSDATGDEIYVDGRRRGVTPIAGAIVLDPGAHAVTIKRGAIQHTENVTLAAGEERALTLAIPAAVTTAPTPGSPGVVAVDGPTEPLAGQEPPARPSQQPDPATPELPRSGPAAGGGVAPAVTLVREPGGPGAPAAPAGDRRRWWLWGAVGGAVVLVVIGSLFVFRGTSYPDPEHKVTF
jgi:hypothetical protein